MNQRLISGLFLFDWKKPSSPLFIKKRTNKILKNFYSVSLFSACGKMFTRTIFNEMFRFILDNNLLTTIYSDFKPGHYCINRLLSVPHEIYKFFANDVLYLWYYCIFKRTETKLEKIHWLGFSMEDYFSFRFLNKLYLVRKLKKHSSSSTTSEWDKRNPGHCNSKSSPSNSV